MTPAVSHINGSATCPTAAQHQTPRPSTACEVVHCPIHHTGGALLGSPLLPPHWHEDDSCRAQGREPHAFSKQLEVANESQNMLAYMAFIIICHVCQGISATYMPTDMYAHVYQPPSLTRQPPRSPTPIASWRHRWLLVHWHWQWQNAHQWAIMIQTPAPNPKHEIVPLAICTCRHPSRL